jgi:hypothetical protein
MVKRECPSLHPVAPEDITLKLRFDGSSTGVQNVLFRVLPEAWPAAITDTLPLVHIMAKKKVLPTPPVIPSPARGSVVRENKGRKGEDEKEKLTWDDLVRQGALLGVQGSTDLPGARSSGIRGVREGEKYP